MKRLFIPIAFFVALIVFFIVIIDHKEFNHCNDFQMGYSHSSINSSVSISQTKIGTEISQPNLSKNTESATGLTAKAKSSGKEDNYKNTRPAAIPVLTPEEAIIANNDALHVFTEKEKSRKQPNTVIATAKSQDKPLPVVIPVLTPEEAIKVNKEAIRYQRNETIAKAFSSFIHKIGLNNNRIHFILSLLPLLFIFDVLPFKKTKKRCSKAVEYFSLPRRVRILFSISLLAFGILVFVPWSIYFGNSLEFPFIFQDFVNWNLRVLTISIVLASIILLLIPPIISDYILAIIAGLGLCVYVQDMFMNQHLGIMDGAKLDWSEHRIFGTVNLIVWIVIITAPIVLRKITPSLFSIIVSTATGIVLFLEILATVSMVLSANQNVWVRTDTYYIDGSKQFQLSKEKNAVVFIMDALGSGYVQKCFEIYPETKEIVKDFIWFEDARSNYQSTFPGMVHELTGAYLAIPAKNYNEMFDKTWHSMSAKSFYKQINDAGYDARFYIPEGSNIIGAPNLYHEYFSNVVAKDITYTIDYNRIHSCLKKMSGFSFAPYFLKRLFFYSFDFSNGIVEKHISDIPQDNNTIPIYNPDFLRKMTLSGITPDADKPILSFWYIVGAHHPWIYDEKCNKVEESLDNPLPQTRGCFHILSEFIRLLKEANIYDNTAILVCSDHAARSIQYHTPCDLTFMIKPSYVSKAEVSVDDSPVQSLDILPTLLKEICGGDADFKDFEGCPSYDFDIPNERIRKVYRLERNKVFPDYDGWGSKDYNCLGEYNFITIKTFNWGSDSFIRQIPFKGEDLEDK